MQGLDSVSKIMKKIIPNFRNNNNFFPIYLVSEPFPKLREKTLVSNSLLASYRFDWYQSKETVSLVVYSKWPAMREDLVIVDRAGKEIHLTLYLKTTVYHVHIGQCMNTNNNTC